MNSISVIGRVGTAPEVKQVGGKSVASFRLAVSEGKDSTLWLTVEAWERQADVVSRFLTKGSQVGITGRLRVREYQTKDGATKTSVEVVAGHVSLVGGRSDGGKSDGGDSGIPF